MVRGAGVNMIDPTRLARDSRNRLGDVKRAGAARCLLGRATPDLVRAAEVESLRKSLFPVRPAPSAGGGARVGVLCLNRLAGATGGWAFRSRPQRGTDPDVIDPT